NILNGNLEMINYNDLFQYVADKNAILLDVRTPTEFAKGSIKGSINLNVDDLRENLTQLDKNRNYVIYCQVGLRGYLAYKILKNKGFKVVNLNGGYGLWSMIYPN
ncbi:MAG TPA: rhodanese-like domain-containing protein, partial [Chitinophagales bacterium]|nr:rhodanese-like domain-containing protein [Chitinophagales bacterium]